MVHLPDADHQFPRTPPPGTDTEAHDGPGAPNDDDARRRLALFGVARSTLVLFLLLLLLALSALGCGDTIGPGASPGGGGAVYEGQIEPGQGSFVLQRVEVPVPGAEPVAVDLIGSDLVVLPEFDRIELQVALRNAGDVPLYAPAELRLHSFFPATVAALNADRVEDPSETAIDRVWIFDYSLLLGPEEVLLPGERSQRRPWILHDPEVASFSFAAELHCALEPRPAVIRGMVFEDLDEDGVHGRNEGPWLGGVVHLRGPEGDEHTVFPNEDGSFAFGVDLPGLYRLRLESIVDCITCVTTANPLEVLLSEDESGRPLSFLNARFGAVYGPCGTWQGSVRLTDADPSGLVGLPYTLDGLWIEGDVLHLTVAYSGCDAGHDFTLWAGDAFSGDDPPRTWLRLVHDGPAEACLAVFHQELRFDLRAIQVARAQAFGEAGPVGLDLRDHQGMVTSVVYEP